MPDWWRASAAWRARRSRRWRTARTAGEDIADDEWARVYAAFGRVPHEARRSARPRNETLNHRGMDLIRDLDVTSLLGRVHTPTLVSVGELDPVTPVAAAEEIVAALPAGSARLEVVAGAGHFPWLDAPERYWDALRAFIREISG